MIAYLKGTLLESHPQSLILDVQGVGYEAFCSLETYQKLPPVGDAIELHVHTHVREGEIILFAFMDAKEKKVFQRLIRVSGVGPRLAINILSGIAADHLIDALTAQNLQRITAIPGVGKKMGERLILDLKDKIADLQESSVPGTRLAPQAELMEDLLSVLQNLGYKRPNAEKALSEMSFAEDITLQEAVRQTLKYLGNGTLGKTGT